MMSVLQTENPTVSLLQDNSPSVEDIHSENTTIPYPQDDSPSAPDVPDKNPTAPFPQDDSPSAPDVRDENSTAPLMPDNDLQPPKSTEPTSREQKKLYIGYLLLVLLNITDSGPVIFAQVAVGKTSIFELNVIRFTCQAFFCFCVCCTYGQSLRVAHAWYLTPVSALLDYSFAMFVYLGASYMPVGNVFGVFVACYVFFTLCIDLCRKRVKPVFLLSGIPAILGIVLLTQPWHSHYSPSADCVPCDVMDGQTPTHCWNNTIQNHSDIHLNGVSQNYGDGQGTKLIMGYILLAVSGLSSCLNSNICSQLVDNNDPFVVTFWISVQEGIFSLLVAIIIKADDNSAWAINGGVWCLVFTFLFTSLAAVNEILWIVCFCFLPVSHVSVGTSPTTLVLYISQRTFLHQFYPGNANTMEVFGALLVVTGVLVSPFLAMCCPKDQRRLKSEYTEID